MNEWVIKTNASFDHSLVLQLQRYTPMQGSKVNLPSTSPVSVNTLCSRGHCPLPPYRQKLLPLHENTMVYTCRGKAHKREVIELYTKLGSAHCPTLPHSITTTNLHTFVSYVDCLITSGAIQNGVPTNVFRLFMVSVSCPATPKSASLMSPASERRTLAALMSLWSFLWQWR